MIPNEYPCTYVKLRALYDILLDSDEILEIVSAYDNVEDDHDRQAVIDRYQLSSAQVEVVGKFIRIIELRGDYEESLEAGEPTDLSKLNLIDAEVELIKKLSAEGKATEAIMKFSKDGNPEHLAHYFKMFPDIDMIMVNGRCIHRDDIEKE